MRRSWTGERSTPAIRLATLVRNAPRELVLEWLYSDGSLARLTASPKWLPLDSLQGISSRGTKVLRGDIVDGVLHALNVDRRLVTVGLVVDEAAQVLLEQWTTQKLHEKDMRKEYDEALAKLVSVLKQRLV